MVLAEEGFDVVVCRDVCATVTDELHDHELKVINWIYCQVSSKAKTLGFIR